MLARPWSIIAPTTCAAACGSTSAIHTTLQRASPSSITCADALWCSSLSLFADHTSRRRALSTSMITSRATSPLPNVTILDSPSIRQPVTNPGTRRRCSSPTSRIASHTRSADASMIASLWMLAMPPAWPTAAGWTWRFLRLLRLPGEQLARLALQELADLLQRVEADALHLALLEQRHVGLGDA